MNNSKILRLLPLGFPWSTQDPFLFCAYHDDAYPPGNAEMGPATGTSGRRLGMDFEGKDGWRMYHGDVVPGFPRHPHRGFETITLVEEGTLDHSDSLGATARLGAGDMQWLTAGSGVVHSEMFPLVCEDAPNRGELFQIWLNLPAARKMVDPYFTMYWRHQISEHSLGKPGAQTRIRLITGSLALDEGDAAAMPSTIKPPPDSWAADSDNHVLVATLKMQPGAKFQLPASAPGVNRSLYYYEGSGLKLDGDRLPDRVEVRLASEAEVLLEAGAEPVSLLVLEGKPIGEPVAHHGPFVMNSRQELQQAFEDYRRTEFGGWPWPEDGPAHPRTQGRFARHPDGRIDEPEE